jgi:hypothetical protein
MSINQSSLLSWNTFNHSCYRMSYCDDDGMSQGQYISPRVSYDSRLSLVGSVDVHYECHPGDKYTEHGRTWTGINMATYPSGREQEPEAEVELATTPLDKIPIRQPAVHATARVTKADNHVTPGVDKQLNEDGYNGYQPNNFRYSERYSGAICNMDLILIEADKQDMTV